MKTSTKLFAIPCALALMAIGAGLYLKQPKFGALPSGLSLNALKASPNYGEGHFRNIIPTPQFAEDSSLVSTALSMLTRDTASLSPSGPVPSVKIDFAALDPAKDTLIWLGHSSFFVQIGGQRILIDPVLSPAADPLGFLNKAFPGATPYAVGDFPALDYLIITHDHWDHLDYPTVTALKERTGRIIAPLGVGGYFRQWGFDGGKIHELDWFRNLDFGTFIIHALPARHFSGRSFERDKTLWCGFALISQQRKLFFSGDSGYGPHFSYIGEKFGGFDFATLDSGQYDKNWPYIHMTPEQAVQAAQDLGAKTYLPGHIGKFSIANHPWKEPFDRANAASQGKPYRLITPVIGQPVNLADDTQTFRQWWKEVK